jgi:2,4-dienoyl-CoA reductase-like NADH-dependent reductase (Old Yellow Enzyme family)/thioredoxin reductase
MLDHLFAPLRIGPLTIQNRIVSTSHQTSLVHDHLPTDDLVAYHETRARGGAGMICIEATAIHHTGLLTAHTIGGYLPEIVPVYGKLSDAVHRHGTALVVQLFHGGREVIAAAPRPPAVAPSSVPSARFRTEPRALTRREIREMIEGYRRAAAFAVEGGVDGVEVCAGFDYLPTQFLSPQANRRTDEYGGSFDNRLRFLREVCEAMRDGAGPGGVVGCRLTDEHWSWDGNDDDDLLQAAAELSRAGLIDYLSVALGSSSTLRGSSWIVPPVPVEHNAIAAFARRMKQAVEVPVIATGRIVEPADADAMIARGDCDACGMTRALITDPAMPAKARRGEPHNRCIGCNQGCIGHYHAGLPIACTINPWTGHEARLPRPATAAEPQRIVVVGAGPAGAAAAAIARAQGHRVVVFERGSGPGGQMRLALDAPGHREIAAGLVDALTSWLDGCDVRYGVDAGADGVLAEAPDRVVIATGAGRFDLDLPGEGPVVVHAWDVLGGAQVEGAALVADWGGDWTGLAVAETLAERSVPVRVAVATAGAGEGMHVYQRNMYLERLDVAGVELLHHLRPVRLDGDGVLLENVFSHREVRVPGVGTLVVSAGRVSDAALFEQLEDAGLDVVRVGDVLSPRSFEEAIREGTEAMLAAESHAAAV